MFGSSPLSRFIIAKFYHYTGLSRKLTTALLVLQYLRTNYNLRALQD
jgi:hypothetical protein